MEETKNKIEIFGEDIKDPVMEEPDVPKYAPDEVEKVMRRATELPYEIKANENQLFALSRKDDFITKKVQENKDRIYMVVFNEKDPPMLRYPDQPTQDREVEKRLIKDELFIEKISEELGCVTIEKDDDGKNKYTTEKARKDESIKRAREGKEIKELVKGITIDILNESEPGKDTFTNERSRDIEVSQRLQENVEHKLLMEEQKKTIQEMHHTKSQIYLLRSEFKSIEIITELMKIKMRI